MQAARGTPLNEHEPEHPRRPHLVLFAVVAVAALALDVVSKIVVAAHLPLTRPTPVRLLGGAIYLDQVRNSGAAFSFGTGFTVVLTVVALAVVVVIVRTARRLFSAGWSVALALVLGGALGNLADRLFRSPGVGRGHVVDWISVFGPYGQKWPIFNLADAAITCGAVLAAVLALLGVDFDGRRTRRPSPDDDA
ncbi:signal peptidase II [Jatrophihabitans endophyticus]|uniref:signal peptidase II n=1 Tax=Jatrophihabitans endophyticus TaxID=1206085 RepID=UPI0026EEAED6|nr:signal peptidase II [Jatrophihabitans endophyticus]